MLVGGLIGVALMVPLLLLWRGVAGALPAPGGLWPMLLPLPALIGAGWSAATLAGTARRRIAALHGVAVWALLLTATSIVAGWHGFGRDALPPEALHGAFDFLLSKLNVFGAAGRRSASGWTPTRGGDSEGKQ